VTDAEWEILAPFLPGDAPCGRERVGREASPAAAVIDSQSDKTTESGGLRGFDAGKEIKGRKRLAKDVEATIKSDEAFLYAASAILPIRRLAR
jgi:putative transposase